METDIDNNKSDNRANEFEQQLRMETRAVNSNKTDIYLNAYESSALNHEYKNLNQHDKDMIDSREVKVFVFCDNIGHFLPDLLIHRRLGIFVDSYSN